MVSWHCALFYGPHFSLDTAEITTFFLFAFFVNVFFQYKSAPRVWEDQWVDVISLVAREVDNQGIGKHWFGASYKMGSRWKSVASNAALDDVPFCLFCLGWLGVEDLSWEFPDNTLN